MSSLVDQLRYLILGYSLQLYYMRWPMLLRPLRTAFDFSDSIRMVGHSENASERILLEIGPVKSASRHVAIRLCCPDLADHLKYQQDSWHLGRPPEMGT
jgi:hypothetical protein